jgi:hypothetical protein
MGGDRAGMGGDEVELDDAPEAPWRFVLPDARVVDEHLEAAEELRRLVDDGPARELVRQIARHHRAGAAGPLDFSGDGGERVAAARGDGDLGFEGGELESDYAAEP